MIDVAKACGVAHSTVSRALRNHPSIPAATRRRIEEAAKSLGFRPDPNLSLLMAKVRHGRASAIQATLGLIHVAPVPEYPEWPDTHRSEYIRGVRDRAEALGYSVDPFYLDRADMKGSDLKRVFRARGIQGAVLIDGSRSTSELGIDWSIAAWATVGFFSETPALHAAAGVSAVDLVVGQLLRGERGLPDFEKRVLVRGHWSNGKSRPGASPPNHRRGRTGRPVKTPRREGGKEVGRLVAEG